MTVALQPETGPIAADTYLAVESGSALWGRLPCANDRPGDLLRITVPETLPRVPYGIITNRRSRERCTGTTRVPTAP